MNAQKNVMFFVKFLNDSTIKEYTSINRQELF